MAINPLLDNLSELSEEQLLDIVNDLSSPGVATRKFRNL
jgi:hypothetical protein